MNAVQMKSALLDLEDDYASSFVVGVGDRLRDTNATSDGDDRTAVKPLPERQLALHVPTTKRMIVSYTDADQFRIIKNWEGVVTGIGDEVFTARMRDERDPNDRGDEEFEISIGDVPEGDLDLLVEGGIFYFTIGYESRPGGPRRKVSQVVFRRMPNWHRNDLQRISSVADSWFDKLGEGS